MTKLKERFDTLSDAIIAIIMTILVLEITVPHNTTELISLFKEISLFIISFIILIDFWYQRTNLMNLAKQTTLKLL
ncbi:TMEM175 family protein [Enterococcus cecorum]|uniref:TMEM175 family protein n=1 Tax=Enterococcus cecorum TaxID=44008 RepID=UPI002ACA7FEE|nr:TMEM175 family protein [Enterococcus cecorum]MDZ5578098.1 TMEM175 family protein [Enterococcus cecorum]